MGWENLPISFEVIGASSLYCIFNTELSSAEESGSTTTRVQKLLNKRARDKVNIDIKVVVLFPHHSGRRRPFDADEVSVWQRAEILLALEVPLFFL